MTEEITVKKNRLNALIKMAMHLCVLCPRQRGPKTCQGYNYCHRTLFNYVIDREKDIKEENIAMVLALEYETSIESLDAKLDEMQQELLKRANARQDYEEVRYEHG